MFASTRDLALTMVFASAAAFTSSAAAKTLHPDYLLLRGEVQTYEDWLAGCDNTGVCTLLGIPRPHPSDGILELPRDMGLRITLTQGAEAQVATLPVGPPPLAQDPPLARPFRLPHGFDPLTFGPVHGYSPLVLPPQEAAAVLEILAEYQSLTGFEAQHDRAFIRFPGPGFNEAMRAVDAHRQRQHASPAQGVPATEVSRLAATPLVLSGYPAPVAAADCGDQPVRAIAGWQFADGARLWRYACGEGSAPEPTFWLASPAGAAMPAPLILPDPRDGPITAGSEGLIGAVFDFDFGILRSYQTMPGHADCGTFRAWGYTPDGWQLLQRSDMPLCRGLEPEDWIITWHLPSAGLGPD